MSLTIQDILDRIPYKILEIPKNFIFNGDTFVLMVRDKGHIYFQDYGVCSDYRDDPDDDHIIMRYFSLEKFPPVPMILNLPVEDVLKGKYMENGKTYEIKKFNSAFSIQEEELDEFTSYKLSSEKVHKSALAPV